MKNHSRKELSLLENSSGHLHCHSCSLPIILFNRLTASDQGPHPIPTLLPLNICWKQRNTGNFEFGHWGPYCQPILNVHSILNELTRVLLASLAPQDFFV